MNAFNWHFSRLPLAKQVIGMFESGLSTALVFFAPRRMGKTEFLLKDILPAAEKNDWQVCYHSFLDTSKNAEIAFTKSLQECFDEKDFLKKSKQLTHKIKNISAGFVGMQGSIELHNPTADPIQFKDLLVAASKHQKLLLLMDEIQALAKDKANFGFITALRTVLDVHKDRIKVIFTGSSREGLKKIFSSKEAPFFHFGQNLSFPQLGPEFTQHLAKQYTLITQKTLDEQELWKSFEAFRYVPQLIRALVERLILQPNLTIQQAAAELLDDVSNDRAFDSTWNILTHLEQLILQEIVNGNQKLYSQEVRIRLSELIGLPKIPVSSIQAALRKLVRNNVIGQVPEEGKYFIDDPNFQDWIQSR